VRTPRGSGRLITPSNRDPRERCTSLCIRGQKGSLRTDPSTLEGEPYDGKLSRTVLRAAKSDPYSLLAVCLIIQIVSGVMLAMHYNPSVAEAFNSVEHIAITLTLLCVLLFQMVCSAYKEDIIRFGSI